jgi:hypothetical protein
MDRLVPVRLAALGAAVALGLGLAVPAEGRPRTTFEQTILDRDTDNRLEPAPGEPYVIRDDLGTAPAPSRRRGVPLVTFAQQTDSHVVDEESPLRVEFLDRFGPPFTSAYRPQEGLSPQVLNEMVEQIRNTVSPATSRKVELVMTTGDNTDNTQCNETRWLIDLMDGDQTVDPNSGLDAGVTGPFNECDTVVRDAQGAPVDPNPAFPATSPAPVNPACGGLQPGPRYRGVRGQNEYYEPDSSRPQPGADNEDGPGYSPDQRENELEAQRPRSVRDFPDLFERMNEPFRATGYGDLPWFGIFGNHDGLLQGNQPRNPAFEAYGVGCVKVEGSTTLPAMIAARRGAQSEQNDETPGDDTAEESGISPAERNEIFGAVLGDVLTTAAGAPAGPVEIVPPDPRRRPLKKSEYIAEHFDTTGTPVGHGFTPANVASGQGNYSIQPKPGVRFIVLDSINETGGAEGNIDDNQFRWLHRELKLADGGKERAVVFAHHSLRTMNQTPLSGFPPGDTGGDFSAPHFGTDGDETPNECVITDPAAEPTLDETVRCLLLRHPSVIAFVNGHEHANRITPVERREGRGRALGGFWEINTAAHIDYPQQSRLLDIVDNGPTVSIFTTILDHSGEPNPGGAPCDRPSGSTGQSGCEAGSGDASGNAADSVRRMASISRELSFNDPDASTDEQGRGGARGGRQDRNAELIVNDPVPGP